MTVAAVILAASEASALADADGSKKTFSACWRATARRKRLFWDAGEQNGHRKVAIPHVFCRTPHTGMEFMT